MKLIVENEKCIKSGECYFNHPTLFKGGSDGFPVVLVADIGDDQLDAAEQAAYACPGRALKLEKSPAK